MEEIPSYLYPGLAQLQKRSGSEGKGKSCTVLVMIQRTRCLFVCLLFSLAVGSGRGDAEIG